MSKSYLTLRRENKFSFTCPIFDAKVPMRSCVVLQEKVYRGERVQTRRGCQACITSSKCPASAIIRGIAFNGADATDHCAATEDKHGRLPASALERVYPVVVLESELRRFDVPAAERDMIANSGARIAAQMGGAPREKIEARRSVQIDAPEPRRASQRPAERDSAPKTTQPTTISKAAATGDLSAALNVA
jgi:hypothetical protein